MKKNNYEVIVEGAFGVVTEYKGTCLKKAIKRFMELDGNKNFAAYIFINGEEVTFKA